MPRRFPITELFGYPHDNTSRQAVSGRSMQHCPFLNSTCQKQIGHKGFHLGNCSVHTNLYGPVITCPKRFAGGGYQVVDKVARELMGPGGELVKVAEVQMTPLLTAELDHREDRCRSADRLCER